MPTGITSDIYDGKDLTLRGYLLRVGRSMSYSIMQRDSPLDEPPKRSEPSRYHAEALAKAEARVEELLGMLEEQAAPLAAEAHEQAMARYEHERAANQELRERYEKMIAAVEGWTPDPLVAQTKEYALKQLRESLDFDCGYRSSPPQRRSPMEWWENEIGAARNAAQYHREEGAKEIARAAERNLYIDALYASLPKEA